MKDSRDKILQHAMDRFLFHDGYFPVTHSSASRGFMDTLLLENAETSGVPPLLVVSELKQVTAFANPAEASRAALGEARIQLLEVIEGVERDRRRGAASALSEPTV